MSFGSSSPPPVQPAPLPPAQDPAALAATDAAAVAQARRLAAGGRASTQLTDGLGDVSDLQSATKRLLGQ